ncbi:caspase family protein (plasmid) [Isosphaeraceae bacterium EP7]
MSKTHFLAVILGAKEFPDAPGFTSDLAFERSRDLFKKYAAADLGVRFAGFRAKAEQMQSADGLDLFNSDRSADDQDAMIGRFLKGRLERLKAEGKEDITLLLYYVGHGAFSGQDFYFAVKKTRAENPLASSFIGKTLAETVKREAAWIRLCAILDACFSAEAARLFLGSGDEAAARSFVKRGISLLCSAPSNAVSYILPDSSGTAFTDGFVSALREGVASGDQFLTLRQLKDLASRKIESRKEDLKARLDERAVADYDPPDPQLHSPSQPGGDLADVPLFPNPARVASQSSGDRTEPSGPVARTETTGQSPDPPGNDVSALLEKKMKLVEAKRTERQKNVEDLMRRQEEARVEVREEVEGIHERVLDATRIAKWLDQLKTRLQKEDEAAATDFQRLSAIGKELPSRSKVFKEDLRRVRLASERASARRLAAKQMTAPATTTLVAHYDYSTRESSQRVPFASWVESKLSEAADRRVRSMRWNWARAAWRWAKDAFTSYWPILALWPYFGFLIWCGLASPLFWGSTESLLSKVLARIQNIYILGIYIVPGAFLFFGCISISKKSVDEFTVGCISAFVGALLLFLGVKLTLEWGYGALMIPQKLAKLSTMTGFLIGIAHLVLILLGPGIVTLALSKRDRW